MRSVRRTLDSGQTLELPGVPMQVLWWLVPPLAATLLAMLWAGWAGRERDEVSATTPTRRWRG